MSGAAGVRELLWKLGRRGPRRALHGVSRRLDLRSSTFGPAEAGVELASMAPRLSPELLEPHREWIAAVAGRYAAHRFDLLGSGWVRVAHGMECAGVEEHRYAPGPAVRPDRAGAWLAARVNAANAAESARVWSLVDPEYIPIDWHLDFKSGHRWQEDVWYRDVRPGGPPGVDVKVPWELSRMQHLPQLAWAHALAVEDGDAAAAQRWAGEFRNQVLDWIAANPPRFGVNWASTMDVAIRAANWVAAADLFRAWGARFDAPFQAELVRSLRAHGRHVAVNLEWAPRLRGNHYLSNVAGLLFIAAALPAEPRTDAWLAWSIQELVSEAEFQFNPDGGNFEGSTAYHRLSLELLAMATAVVLGLPPERRAAMDRYSRRWMRVQPPLRPAPLPRFAGDSATTFFPPAYADRLARAARFAADCAAPSGDAIQVGDNDSGRFLKLAPALAALPAAEARARFSTLPPGTEGGSTYWYENPLDHAGARAVTEALFGRQGARPGSAAALEGAWAAGVARGARLDGAAQAERAAGEVRMAEDAPANPWGRETVFAAPGGDLRAGMVSAGYPDFGLWVLRSERLYLAVRCGAPGQRGRGGHAHNDQLSVELWIDGEPLARDPGTYLYTALPARRDQFRSVARHFAPQVPGREPADLGQGLFRLEGPAGRCTAFGPGEFAGVYDGYGFALHRRVVVEADRVRVLDGAEGAPSGTALEPGTPRAAPFSPGYGILES